MLLAVAKRISIVAALIDDGQGRVFLGRKRGAAAFMQAGGKADGQDTPISTVFLEIGASDKAMIGFVTL